LQLGKLTLGSLDLREEDTAVGRYGNEVRDAVLVGLEKLDDIVSLGFQLLDALALYLLLGHIPTR
tara:strand:- start:991 stop:1185 length:195 start_codon:yes stop_codon:yes gene_type:complete